MKNQKKMKVTKKERAQYIKWMRSYFGKSDTQSILMYEKLGQDNPEAFWCSAMAIRYINLLAGISKTKELDKIERHLIQVSSQIKSKSS